MSDLILSNALEGQIRITQGFGWRPQYYAQFGLPGHEGIDMVGSGAHVLAAADGIVYQVGWLKPGHAYGYAIRVRHAIGDKTYSTVYAHGAEGSALVKVGYHVTASQPLMRWDSTGNTQGAHLHLSLLLDGATNAGLTNYPYDIIDPTPYLLASEPDPANMPPRVKIIAFDGLRVRSGPGTQYAKITTLDYGTVVKIVDVMTVANMQWGRIDTPDQAGWIALIYTEPVKP